MERREGAEYDFNEPQLESAVVGKGEAVPVVVALLFLQPGRHAGPGGDVKSIIAEALQQAQAPARRVFQTEVVSPWHRPSATLR